MKIYLITISFSVTLYKKMKEVRGNWVESELGNFGEELAEYCRLRSSGVRLIIPGHKRWTRTDPLRVVCAISQLEVGNNGTIHEQGFVCFDKKIRMSTLMCGLIYNGYHDGESEINIDISYHLIR